MDSIWQPLLGTRLAQGHGGVYHKVQDPWVMISSPDNCVQELLLSSFYQ